MHQLPADCHESAQTPQVLFEKLSQWGFDTLVIPHGTTWGFYTPPGSTFDKQLTVQTARRRQAAPVRDLLGPRQLGGVSLVAGDRLGRQRQPDVPRADEELRAVLLARRRDHPRPLRRHPEGSSATQRVATARLNYLKAGVTGRMTVPGATPDDWKDCGQCRDCFNPAFNYRPGNSAQYALAITNFDDPAQPAPLQLRASSPRATTTRRARAPATRNTRGVR